VPCPPQDTLSGSPQLVSVPPQASSTFRAALDTNSPRFSAALGNKQRRVDWGTVSTLTSNSRLSHTWLRAFPNAFPRGAPPIGQLASGVLMHTLQRVTATHRCNLSMRRRLNALCRHSQPHSLCHPDNLFEHTFRVSLEGL
jgi:hypothetical protein